LSLLSSGVSVQLSIHTSVSWLELSFILSAEWLIAGVTIQLLDSPVDGSFFVELRWSGRLLGADCSSQVGFPLEVIWVS